MPSRGRTLPVAAGACLALALASLGLPSGPTYDPYSWLIWGRDLAHLDLATTGTGTSWKPLPAVIDAVLTPLGGGAADGWLVVARAGALFAVFMAFWLACRLAPRRGRALAGFAAAAALVLTHDWVKRNAVGDAEGLMTAFGLLAVERHLAGRRGQAFALLVGAGLIRVEAWPFVLAYAAWLWWGHRISHGWLALGTLAMPLLWFGGDWLGSGRLTTAADIALRPVPGTPGASAHPALSVLTEARTMLPLPAWIGIGCALAVLARGLPADGRATRPHRVVAALAAVAVIWTAIVALMAQRGYAGLPRFLFMANGCEAVVAGIGIGYLADLVPRFAPARRTAAAAAAAVATALIAAAFAYAALPNAKLLPGDLAAVDKVADMDAGLAQALRAAGGSHKLLRCGLPSTTWYGVTALAWDLQVVPGSDPAAPRRAVFVTPRGDNWRVDERRCPSSS